VEGPAIVESPFSTVVVDPGTSARRRPSGSLVIAMSTSEKVQEGADVHAIGD
jgi:hypothetical protein